MRRMLMVYTERSCSAGCCEAASALYLAPAFNFNVLRLAQLAGKLAQEVFELLVGEWAAS